MRSTINCCALSSIQERLARGDRSREPGGSADFRMWRPRRGFRFFLDSFGPQRYSRSVVEAAADSRGSTASGATAQIGSRNQELETRRFGRPAAVVAATGSCRGPLSPNLKTIVGATAELNASARRCNSSARARREEDHSRGLYHREITRPARAAARCLWALLSRKLRPWRDAVAQWRESRDALRRKLTPAVQRAHVWGVSAAQPITGKRSEQHSMQLFAAGTSASHHARGDDHHRHATIACEAHRPPHPQGDTNVEVVGFRELQVRCQAPRHRYREQAAGSQSTHRVSLGRSRRMNAGDATAASASARANAPDAKIQPAISSIAVVASHRPRLPAREHDLPAATRPPTATRTTASARAAIA